MCEELKKGNILYVIRGANLDILEVEDVSRTREKRDRMIAVKSISLFTSHKYLFFVPENIRDLNFIERGEDIITCNESIAMSIFENNISKDEKRIIT